MNELEAVRRHMTERLGLRVGDLERLGVTAYNEHYRAVVDGVTRHLVVYNLPEQLPIKGILFEHAILRHLAERGFREAPELLAVGGETLYRVDDCFYSLTEWISGCHTEQDLEVTSAQLVDAARVLARFHRCTSGLELKLDYFPEHIFVYTTAHFLDDHDALLDQLGTRVFEGHESAFDDEARKYARWFLPQAREFLGAFDRGLYDRVRAADPTGVVHGDYRRINLVFDGDRVSKVLDYNCCFNDIRLWDVAYTALSFGGKETVGPVDAPEVVADFVRAYDEFNPLTSDEWALLPDFLTFVVVKLMTAAIRSWWINERADSMARLKTGEAERIVRLARSAHQSVVERIS